MAKQININDNSNKVNLEDVNPKIVVRDDNKNTIVNVESKNTKIVQVNTPGPRGPKGDVGPSGSVDGVVITDNNDNEKKKVLFVIEQPGGSGTTGSLGTDSNLQALSFNPSEEILFSSNISSSGFLKGYNITASGKISASQQIIGPSATLGKFFLSNNIISNTDDDTTKITFEGSDKIMITVNDEDGIDIESSQENDKIIFYKKADFKSSISASGAFFFSSSLNDDTNFKTLVYDTSTGKVFHTGSYGGGGGGVGFPYSGSDAQFGTPPQAIITGSLLLSGSGHITASGTISASGGFTGSLFGTSSFSTTSSFAISSSYAVTASHALNAASASFAVTSSHALNAVSASFAITSSHALTASFIDSTLLDTFKQTGQRNGDAAITGSLTLTNLTASGEITSSNYFVNTGDIIPGTSQGYFFDINKNSGLTHNAANDMFIQHLLNGKFVRFTGKNPAGATQIGATIDYGNTNVILGDLTTPFTVTAASHLFVKGNVSASEDFIGISGSLDYVETTGNISASGLLFASSSQDTASAFSNFIVVHDTSSGRFYTSEFTSLSTLWKRNPSNPTSEIY